MSSFAQSNPIYPGFVYFVLLAYSQTQGFIPPSINYTFDLIVSNLLIILFKVDWKIITYPDGADLADNDRDATASGEIGVLAGPDVSKYCGSDWPPSTWKSSTTAAFALYTLLHITCTSNTTPCLACLVMD